MKTAVKMVGAVFLFDLLFYPLLRFILLPNTDNFYANLAIILIRVAGCSVIGLLFARYNRNRPANLRKALWISLAAGLLGLFYLFYPKPYVFFMELFWVGEMETLYQLGAHPVRVFLIENLCDQWSVVSYMCLIIAFQLGRLRFSRKFVPISSPDPAD